MIRSIFGALDWADGDRRAATALCWMFFLSSWLVVDASFQQIVADAVSCGQPRALHPALVRLAVMVILIGSLAAAASTARAIPASLRHRSVRRLCGAMVAGTALSLAAAICSIPAFVALLVFEAASGRELLSIVAHLIPASLTASALAGTLCLFGCGLARCAVGSTLMLTVVAALTDGGLVPACAFDGLASGLVSSIAKLASLTCSPPGSAELGLSVLIIICCLLAGGLISRLERAAGEPNA